MRAPVLVAVTDARSAIAHLVTYEAMEEGRLAGRYQAVCEFEVLPTALTAEESGSCRKCRRWRAGA